jgi:hypothetical protein
MESRFAASGWSVRPRHRAILARLDDFLRELRASPSLRRELRTDARRALAARSFCCDDLPETLPSPRQLDPLLTQGQLFGLTRAWACSEPALELRLLAYGAKPMVLIHGQEAELCAALAWAEQRGFTVLLSADEWDRESDAGKGGYSNLATNMRRACAGSGAWRSLLAGADEDRVVLAWLALTFGWDEALGRLLGYPACCTSAFARNWREAVTEHQGDVVAVCIRQSGPGPHDWRVNVLGRYFGAEVIQHFPCHFDCAASLALAEQTRAVLAACEPSLHAWCEEVLNAPVLYTDTSGVAVLRGATVLETPEGARASYDPRQVLVTESYGALDLALRCGRTVEALPSTRELRLGEERMLGSLVVFSAR